MDANRRAHRKDVLEPRVRGSRTAKEDEGAGRETVSECVRPIGTPLFLLCPIHRQQKSRPP